MSRFQANFAIFLQFKFVIWGKMCWISNLWTHPPVQNSELDILKTLKSIFATFFQIFPRSLTAPFAFLLIFFKDISFITFRLQHRYVKITVWETGFTCLRSTVFEFCDAGLTFKVPFWSGNVFMELTELKLSWICLFLCQITDFWEILLWKILNSTEVTKLYERELDKLSKPCAWKKILALDRSNQIEQTGAYFKAFMSLCMKKMQKIL